MSAFEVCKTHIDVLISAALQRVHGDTLSWYHGEIPGTQPGEALPSREDYLAALKKAKREVTKDNAGTWGALLAAENRRSVNHRYDEDEIEEPYEFTEYAGHFDPAKVLAAISCYEYQSCEHPEWKASEAKSFCEALTGRMIGMLPGYRGVWEVTDASEVMTGQAMRVASAAEMRRRLRQAPPALPGALPGRARKTGTAARGPETMNIDLNQASNPLGPLNGEVRARVVAAIQRPSEETWDDAHGVILNRDSWMTLWQAVMAVDPTFPRTGPVTRWVEDDGPLGGHSEPVSGWERIPDAETIIQAVNYATR